MDLIRAFIADLPLILRVVALAGVAALAHLVVLLLRRSSSTLLQSVGDRRYRKLRSVGTLATSIAMFVELQSALEASVFIPNRTINNVINYPRGYVRCIVDVTLRGDEDARRATEAAALNSSR